jgi:hypothetical protein
MAAMASERSSTGAGKVVSCEGGEILLADMSIDQSSEKNGRTFECLHAQLREMIIPTG